MTDPSANEGVNQQVYLKRLAEWLRRFRPHGVFRHH